MNTALCLFCNHQESNYKLVSGVDFVCSNCVQLLLGASQEDLKRAHTKAIDKGYMEKAKAIESFLDEEEYYGKTENTKPNLERTRPLPAVRPSRHKVRA